MNQQVTTLLDAMVFLAKYGEKPERWVGQVSEFKLENTVKTENLINYTGGGGIADSVSIIEEVKATFTSFNLDAENLKRAIMGESSALTAGAVSNEAATAYAGGLLGLAHMIGAGEITVTVAPSAWSATQAHTLGEIVKPGTGNHFYKCSTAGTSGETEPTWKNDGTTTTDGTVVWTDMGSMVLNANEYTLKNGVVTIPDTSTKIAAAGTPVTVSYHQPSGSLIQALTAIGSTYHIVVAGVNRKTGKTIRATLHKVQLDPAKDLGLITTTLSNLVFTGTLLQDQTITGTGLSQFYILEVAE